jgi:hypothetical protein
VTPPTVGALGGVEVTVIELALSPDVKPDVVPQFHVSNVAPVPQYCEQLVVSGGLPPGG